MTDRRRGRAAGTSSGSASRRARRRWWRPADGTAEPVLEPRLRGVRPDQRLGGREDLPLAAPGSPRTIRSRPGRRSGTFPPTRSPTTERGSSPIRRPAGSSRSEAWCASPTRLTLEMLGGLPRVSYTVKHHCVEGWTAIGTWTGVPVSVVAELVRPLPEARYLRFDSFDSGYSNGWDLTSAMHPQTILAYAYNDRPLTASGARRSGSTPRSSSATSSPSTHHHELHPRAARRVLGGPGLSLARGGLASPSRSG